MEEPSFSQRLPIVDGHLDLAENVTLFGRDLTLPVAQIRATERRSSRQATVSLPELERGNVAVAIATVTGGFLAKDVGKDFKPQTALYRTAQEAEANALTQIQLYERWQLENRVRLIKSAYDLEHHLQLWQQDGKPGLVLLMEGADPIVDVDDLSLWWQRGLRMIGITFGDTAYGTGARGDPIGQKTAGLTTRGVHLLEHMAELGFIWDVSHLAEAGIWQGLDLNIPHVCASHANAQALIPTDRHLSDAIICAIGGQGGVIGVVLYNGFLAPHWPADRATSVTLVEHVRRHTEYVASLIGWDHVGIGSDLDGGFGLEESPMEIDTVADLQRIAVALPDGVGKAVLSNNWLRFLEQALP